MNKIPFRADLHCHSTCSDGTDTPLELLQKAKEADLQGLSITDHDTTHAYTPALFARAKELGIALLTGIEISTEFEGATIHVLGYGFNLDSSSLKRFLEVMQERRMMRNGSILKKLTEKKMPITEEELIQFARSSEKKKTIGRPHIAELMVQKGYVKTRGEAFDRYLKEGTACYVPGFKYTPTDAVEEMRKANGKAILAHPHFIQGGGFLKRLLAAPFDGIECYYGNLAPGLEKKWVDLAHERGWIATGGSDYHGSFKPYISLGCSFVTQETFEKLSQSR